MDIRRIWLPTLLYVNTDQKDTTRLEQPEEWDTNVIITKQKKPIPNGLGDLDETETYKGSENKISMNQSYTKRFQCEYQLAKYPFDTHTCGIEMVVTSLEMDMVTLLPGQIIMQEKKERAMYTITQMDLLYREETS